MGWRELAIAGHSGDESLARAALTDPDAQARELAVGALDRMGRLTEHDLGLMAADPAPSVRRRVAMIAARYPGLDLLALLDDGDPVVVEAAAWAAGERGATPDGVLARLIALATLASDALVREAAVASLGAIGDDLGLPAILAACADKPTVRRRAVLALAPFDGPEVEAALDAARKDRDWQVRQAAEDVS